MAESFKHPLQKSYYNVSPNKTYNRLWESETEAKDERDSKQESHNNTETQHNCPTASTSSHSDFKHFSKLDTTKREASSLYNETHSLLPNKETIIERSIRKPITRKYLSRNTENNKFEGDASSVRINMDSVADVHLNKVSKPRPLVRSIFPPIGSTTNINQVQNTQFSSQLQETNFSIENIVNLCRICLDDDSKEDFISPCNCTGTMAYVHKSCLNTWLEKSDNRSKCELCSCKLPLKIKYKSFLEYINSPKNFCARGFLIFQGVIFCYFVYIIIRYIYQKLSGETNNQKTGSKSSEVIIYHVIYLIWAIFAMTLMVLAYLKWRRKHYRCLIDLERLRTNLSN